MNIFKKKKVAITILVVFVLATMMPSYTSFDFTADHKQEDTNEGLNAAPVESGSFVVLEVVPDKAYANFGYNVGGQEPIDVKKLVSEGKAKEIADSFTNNNRRRAFTYSIEYSYKQKKGFVSNTAANGQTSITYASGYYKKVAAGKGDFNLDNYNFVANDKGSYVFVEELNSYGETTRQFSNDKVWMQNVQLPASRVKYKKETLVNNDFFKKVSLNNPKADVVVRTLTPDDLNKQLVANPDYLNDVDLFVISNNTVMQDKVVNLWNQYTKPSGEANHTTGKTLKNTTQFSWNSVLKIFQRVIGAGGSRVPVIFDYSNVTDATTIWKTNLQKLYFMLLKMNPTVFYNLYLNDNTIGGGEAQPTLIDSSGNFNYNGTWRAEWDESWFNPSDSKLVGLYELKSNLASNMNIKVEDNAYFFSGTNASVQFLDDIINDQSISKNVSSDLFDIINKNPEDFKTVGGGTATSPAYSLKYVIKYVSSDSINFTMKISILDVEPCNDFTKQVKDYRMMIPMFLGSINITRQTSNEFNGRVEDLNSKYDMIYLGLNHGNNMFTDKDNDGLPNYNDTSLNGKIYLHVGDRVYGCTASNNLLSDENNYALNWLEKNTGNECRMPGNDISKLKKTALVNFLKAGYPIVVNSTLYGITGEENKRIQQVDSSSNILSFVDSNKTTYKNLIQESKVINSTEITLKQYLTVVKPLISMISVPKEYIGEEESVTSKSPELYINGSNNANRTLDFEFLIADCSFSRDKKYSAMIYVDRNVDGRFSDAERVQSVTSLTVGTHKISANLNKNYYGAVHWKIIVKNEANQYIRMEKEGFSAVCKPDNEKARIRVLQISSQKDGVAASDSNNLNLSTDSRFNYYMKNLKDYDIQVTVLSNKQLDQRYADKKFDTSSVEKMEETDILAKNYDMIVFGFSDMYESLSDKNGAIENLKYFMDLGKSVLFTHDTTSLNNIDQLNQSFGYTFNKKFRGYLGMDRFGARIGKGDTYGLAKETRDKAAKPNGSIYDTIHGYTTAALRRIGSKATPNTLNGIPLFPGVTYGDNPEDGQTRTTKISRLNSGQVTQYPYKIDDSIPVATTHPQYYQLDMEDPNLVVWYCLADDNKTDSLLLSKSPNDASNNYHIYNKGNITFSGVGHSKITNDMEMKLFVNTLIAAYRASVPAPSIEIMDENIPKSGNEYYIYVDYEIDGSNFMKSDTIDIDFVPYENSLLSENMSCFATVGSGCTDPTILNKDGSIVKETMTNVAGRPLAMVKSGNAYKIKCPLELLNNKNRQNILITVENEKGLKGKIVVALIKRCLFDLE